MQESFVNRLKHAYNVFRFGLPTNQFRNVGVGYGYRPDRMKFYTSVEQSIVAPIFTRIAIDVAAIAVKHVRVDEDGQFLEVLDTGLNNCLTTEANIDQSGRDFMQDVVMSLCDEGSIAVVPVDTTFNPNATEAYDVKTMRTARITQWFPNHVEVDLYNRRTGSHEIITLAKKFTAIVENPLYAVMNEPNSTLKRLVEKLHTLDAIDRESGSGKLDLIIQLPYAIKTARREEQAAARKASIEKQLTDSRYGIAYIDSTEHITQLNRPADNNLMEQIEYLTRMLWSQLGLTQEVYEGTASEEAMINYYNRTIEPFLASITSAMRRTFLTKTARTQGQSIMAFKDPFRLVPAAVLAELSDKFTRNEIFTGNEMRAVLGKRPSKDPSADELRNKNLNQNVSEETNQNRSNDERSSENE